MPLRRARKTNLISARNHCPGISGIAVPFLLKSLSANYRNQCQGIRETRSQKNKITRRWARRGTRPAAPKDQRTKSAYIFGAICPELGKGAGLVLPFCNTQTMTLHLAEISLAVAPGAHAVVLMDQAGWHMTGKLDVPGNITIVALPAKCPELNPVENIWQFMRDNWLSNRVFTSHDNIIDHCCEAWNKLIDQPWRIMTIGRRKWARGS
jgi:transposase